MKYVRCGIEIDEQENNQAFMLFEPDGNHRSVFHFLREVDGVLGTIQKEAFSAGFLRFSKDGHKSFSYSESLKMDAMGEDGGLIYQGLLENGGDFIVHPLGTLVVLSKGILDIEGMNFNFPQEIRGSFTLKKGEQGFLELNPVLEQVYFPKGSKLNAKQIVSIIYNIVNCDVL